MVDKFAGSEFGQPQGWPRAQRGVSIKDDANNAPEVIATTPCAAFLGEVAEWSNAPDSKSGLRYCRNVGSNPTLSANYAFKRLI